MASARRGGCAVSAQNNSPPVEGNCLLQNLNNHPVRLRLPPLQRRGIVCCKTSTTTPSGFACHPSTGGELSVAEPQQPPRQAAPATPPQEGNCLLQNLNNHPVRLRLPPLHRRGIVCCRTSTTTPSGCACHPSKGGELSVAEPQQPPRQAAPATPPQEGNCLLQNLNNHSVRLRLPPLHRRGIVCCRTSTTTPSGCACHPSKGEELSVAEPQQPPRQAAPATPPQEGNCLLQNLNNHLVRLRLPPLHRRGIVCCRTSTTTPSGCACHPSTGGELSVAEPQQPPRQAAPATPPQEGNCLLQNLNNHPVRLRLPPLHRRGIVCCRTSTTTPSGCACHPSTGGELSVAEPQQPPRQAAPATPPQEEGQALYLCRHAATPSGFACHPSTGGELSVAEPQQPPRQASPATPPQEGNCLLQNLNNHPVRLRLPPLHRRGIVCCRTSTTTPSGFACYPSKGGELPVAEPQQPPRQAAPATPPQEGNCLLQNLNNHPVRLRLPPLQRRGIVCCRTSTTTPSGCACHPSKGGELSVAEPQQPPRQASPATPPQEGNCLLQNLNNHSVRLRLPPLLWRGIVCCRTSTTTPSGFACHPSCGGELSVAEPQQPPHQASPATPPKEGNCLLQNLNNHPVRLRLPPLHRRGIVCCRTSTTTPSGCACHPSKGGELSVAEPQQPPRQASPATPPQEGNCLLQNLNNHSVRLRLPPLQRKGIVCCRTSTTTPSGFAYHPSKGGEYHFFNSPIYQNQSA